MTTAASPRRHSTRKAMLAGTALAATAIAVAAILMSTSGAKSSPSLNGNATHFSGFQSSYGGCGLPQQALDTQNFVSLNVFDTPGGYDSYPRPVPPTEAGRIGRWENGRNCGRYVQVTIGNYCTGINDGAQGKPFCREGSWINDDFNGSTLTMVVADGCADPTAWCRDDPDHLGLSTTSLTRFSKNGVSVGHIDPHHWNNRQVSWSYVPTPNYSGDLKLGFLRDSQASKPVLAISHLPNGIHGVEYQDAQGAWQQAQPNGDMGQAFVLIPTAIGGTDYRIRVRDASDALVNRGRIYSLSLPAACSPKCADLYTKVDYTTEEAPEDPSSSWTTVPQPTTNPLSASAPPTTTTFVGPVDTTVPPVTTTNPEAPQPPAPQPTTQVPAPQPPKPGCTATYSVVNAWQGGFQVDVTIRNTGPTTLSGWSTAFSVGGFQQYTNPWNAVVTQRGNQISAVNQSYNGTVAPGATAGWGAVVSGVNQPISGLSCSPR